MKVVSVKNRSCISYYMLGAATNKRLKSERGIFRVYHILKICDKRRLELLEVISESDRDLMHIIVIS